MIEQVGVNNLLQLYNIDDDSDEYTKYSFKIYE